MAVPVDNRVDAPGVCGDIEGAPLLKGRVLAQVPHEDDEIRARVPRAVHGLLDGGAELISCLATIKAVDVIPQRVHKTGRCGGGDSVRRTDTDKGHLCVAVLHHSVRLKDELPRHGVLEVAGDIAALQVFSEVLELAHAVVELMVAGDGDVITHRVHDLDEVAAVGDGPDDRALHRVPCVHQSNVGICLFHFIPVERQSRIPDILIHAAVNIIGVDDHDVLVRHGRVGRDAEKRRQQQNRK